MQRAEAGLPAGDAVEAASRIGRPAELAVGVVHDLGNLIQIASSAVNILARSGRLQGAELEPVIAGARTSLERAGVLVRQTLRTARESAATVEDVSLPVCFAEVEALIDVTWDRAVRLGVHVEPGLPAVACDPVGLQSALLNLLFNARDAMPDGGIVSLRAEAVDERTIAIRVVDRGVGMTPDTIARALQPFFSTKRDGLGGVGLPMVERFARESRGRLLIESERGVGTTATLELPAARQASGRDAHRS